MQTIRRFRTHFALACLAVFWTLGAGGLRAAETLDIYFVDPGGAVGNATVIVSPSGESAMLDAGLPFPPQVKKVLQVFELAGVKQIDWMINTHYHADHFGATAPLSEAIPIINFVDHGESVEHHRSDDWWRERRRPWFREGVGKQYDTMYERYLKACEKGRRVTVKPGDIVPMKGVELRVVCAGGKVIESPLPGAGQPNDMGDPRRADDDAEDAQSIGTLVTFGAFKFIYLGDLTWNVSLDLFTARNKVGTVDAYLVTHHAQSLPASLGAYYEGLSACPKAEVHGLRPRVAILSLGTHGHRQGTSEAMENVRSYQGLEDLWQTSKVIEGGEKDHNSADAFIASLTEGPVLRYIKLSASRDGSFTVTNSRTGYTKHYPARQQ
jgi:beta-lactamase superfamily II metal-dependent hydrolase